MSNPCCQHHQARHRPGILPLMWQIWRQIPVFTPVRFQPFKKLVQFLCFLLGNCHLISITIHQRHGQPGKGKDYLSVSCNSFLNLVQRNQDWVPNKTVLLNRNKTLIIMYTEVCICTSARNQSKLFESSSVGT